MKRFIRSAVASLVVVSLSFSLPALAAENHKPVVAQQVASSGVNINTADAQTLADAHIKGIGKKRAEAIIAYREAHGPFKSLDDLKKVKGLSGKIVDANRERLLLN